MRYLAFSMAILAFLLIIAPTVLALTYAGFYKDPGMEIKVVLIPDMTTLLLVSSGMGLLAGILGIPSRWKATAPAGLVMALVSVFVMLAYSSFRTSILNIEILIPIIAGAIAGGMVLNFLDKIFYPQKK